MSIYFMEEFNNEHITGIKSSYAKQLESVWSSFMLYEHSKSFNKVIFRWVCILELFNFCTKMCLHFQSYWCCFLWRLPMSIQILSRRLVFVVFVSLSCQMLCSFTELLCLLNICLHVWLSSLVLQIFFRVWISAKTTHRRSLKLWSCN